MTTDTEDALLNMTLSDVKSLREEKSERTSVGEIKEVPPVHHIPKDVSRSSRISLCDSYIRKNLSCITIPQKPSNMQFQPNLKSKNPNFGYHSYCMSEFTEKYSGSGRKSAPLLNQKASETQDMVDRPTTSWKKCLGPKNVGIPKSYSATGYSVSNFANNNMKRRCKSTDKNFRYGRNKSPCNRKESTSMKSRLLDEEEYLTYTRMLKRLSQIVPHRIDQPYYMSGSTVSLQDRYEADEDRLKQVNMLFQQHATRPHSREFISRYGIGVESSNQDLEGSRVGSSRLSSRQSRYGSARSRNGLRTNSPASADIKNSRSGSARGKRKGSARSRDQDEADNDDVSKTETSDIKDADRDRYSPSPPRRPVISLGGYGLDTTSSTFITSLEIPDGEDGVDLMKNRLTFITKEQHQAFSMIFDEIDYDGNGKLTFYELMDRMFHHVSKKDVKLLMKVFDLNADRTIDRREFTTICALNDLLCGVKTESADASLALDLKTLASHITVYKEMFNMIDQNSNGKIQADEIMLLVTAATGKEIGTDPRIIRHIIRQIETDENGFVDLVSFIACGPFFIKLENQAVNTPNISLAELEEARKSIQRKSGQL